MTPPTRPRARFSLAALLLTLTLAGVGLSAYTLLCIRPTLVVRALSDAEARAVWVYGPSRIDENDQVEGDRRFHGTYRPKNRRALVGNATLIDSLVGPENSGVGWGADCGEDVRVWASTRDLIAELLSEAAKQDTTPPGSVCLTGIVRDRQGNPAPGTLVGVISGGSFHGASIRDDGTFQFFWEANSPALTPDLKLSVMSSKVEATWLQGGGTWFEGYPPSPIQPGKSYQLEIRLP